MCVIRHEGRRFSLLLMVALAALFVGAMGVAGATRGACSGCHGEQVGEWRSSSHSGVSCYRCHQRPGVAGVVEQRVRMVRMVSSAVTGTHTAVGHVRSLHCLECHDELRGKTVVADGIRMRHKDVIERGDACVSCHSSVAHDASDGDLRSVQMDSCLECHKPPLTTDDCATCHVGPSRSGSSDATPWKITHGQTWRYTHGMGDPDSCAACHSRGYCIKCHGMELPHPSAWGNTHGAVAAQAPLLCSPCHTSDLCATCHVTDMPHADGFLSAHSAEAAGVGRAACLTCHIEASCDACHARHIHPGLTPEQIERFGRRS